MPRTTLGPYSVESLRILDESGECDTGLEPALTSDRLLKLYRDMAFARAADEKMLKLQRQGRLGTFPPTTFHEAAHCAPVLAMSEKDWLVGAYRELGARLMRGDRLENLLQLHRGYEEGNVVDNPRLWPVSIIVGAQFLHAVGVAYAVKLRGEADTAVVVFGGDGASSEGDFHEALNFAGVWKVPVVFIVQNNQWAISVPFALQCSSATIAQKAVAYDIPGIRVDGNDPLAMYQATHEALLRAHAGQGPTLIEALTYRIIMHTTADDPTKYRDEKLVREWLPKDPLLRMRRYLERKKLWDEARQQELDIEIKQSIDQAVDAAETMKDYKPDAPFDHVFGTAQPVIEKQRAEFLHQLSEEGIHGQAQSR